MRAAGLLLAASASTSRAASLRFSSSSAMSSKVKVALCQLSVGKDKAANIAHARRALEDASQGGTQLVVLPECWNSPYSTASFPVYAETVPDKGCNAPGVDPAQSPSSAMLMQFAADNKLWLIGGSIPERGTEDDRLYNTCLVIDPSGKVVGKHRKVHLFDIDVPGKITFKESDSLSAGDEVTVVETPFGGVGVGICYDIRFPELAILMRQRGASMLVYPGAFNMVTGPAHWELLQRARAVDNQLFCLTCSPARVDDKAGGYVAWGHSSVVTPWGEVLQRAGHGEEVLRAELDMSLVQTMRDNIPCWKQKRHDIYSKL